MKSWKTTTAGLITAAAAFVLFSPATFAHVPWLVDLARFTAVGGLASFGIAAGDHKNQQ